MLKRLTCVGLTVAAFAGCGEEGPVGLEPLVPEDAVRTYEVILDASAFLVSDTSIGGFIRPARTGYAVVGEDAGGVVDVHALMRFQKLPAAVAFLDTAGMGQTDSTPAFVAGAVVARLDTLRARPQSPVTLALYRTAEAWDVGTATWQMRVDSGGVSEAWTEAGGTRGALVDTATLAVGAEEVVFAVDSATLALWDDTTNDARGGLITSQTPGERVRFSSFRLIVDARPTPRPDTLVTDTVLLSALTFLHDPGADPSGALLVGGTPTWRSYLRLRDRLDTLSVTVPCAEDPEGCTYRLGDVTVNYAALLLQPVEAPPGFAPGDSVHMQIRSALGGGEIPLARAPLGDPISATASMAASRFTSPAADSVVELSITNAFGGLIGADDENRPAAPTLALLDALEGSQFGVAAFARSTAAAGAPKLRLIISVVNEDRIR